ncbi:IclR family transcriptional regulator [Amycolatopsis sp. H20-H5]|uniref:IclR family transcriptional regulator n=1 Tax=Amycolatopsis sp. H20-H5 TaxID=3046309 RepID=UPI002DB82266|nr:IclR family transcriptional regulator [Amycolatopsis sp. H20-H5]MEC3979055.1 IclR family transcriptional regulator [Amycolatopsis sp. H20-H5]
MRGLQILRRFAPERPVLTQTQIAEVLELPLPTVGRLCRALVETGFLELDPGSRRLRLGPEIRRLTGAIHQDTTGDAREWMRALNEQFDEDINLAMLDDTHALYLDTAPGTSRLGVQTQVGSRAQAHCTAVGKCLLAQLDDPIVLDRLGRGPYERQTDKTIRYWPELREELDTIRRTGFSRSIEEFEVGLAGFAVAVPRRGDDVQLALSVAVPTARLQPGRAHAIESALLAGPHPVPPGVELDE